MDVQATLVTGALLAIFTLILSVQGRGQFRALDRRISELRDETRGEISQVRAEIAQVRGEVGQLRGEIVQVRTEIAELRSDLLHVALAVGARPRPQSG